MSLKEKSESKMFASRLSIAMEFRKMKQTDIVRLTGISKASISQYLSGNAMPKSSNIKIIAEAMDITELWLLGYNAPMSMEAYQKQQENFSDLLEKRKNLILDIYDKSCKMSVEGATFLNEFAEFLLKKPDYSSFNYIIQPFGAEEYKKLRENSVFWHGDENEKGLNE